MKLVAAFAAVCALVSVAHAQSCSDYGSKCADLSLINIIDMKVDALTGLLFVVDQNLKVTVFSNDCEESTVILDGRFDGDIAQPNAIAISEHTMVNKKQMMGGDDIRVLYISNQAPPNYLFEVLFNFDTLEIVDKTPLYPAASYINDLEMAPNGDVLIVDRKHIVIQYDVITGQSHTIVPANSGIVDIFGLATSSNCPWLYITANDNDHLWRCNTIEPHAQCTQYTNPTEMQNPWGVDMDACCQVYAANQADGDLWQFDGEDRDNLPASAPPLQCASQAYEIEAPVHIDAQGAIVAEEYRQGHAMYTFSSGGSFWALTKCTDGKSDSWVVNGQTWHVPQSSDFEWHEYGVPNGVFPNRPAVVMMGARESNCQVSQVYMGGQGDRLLSGLMSRDCGMGYACADEFCVQEPLTLRTSVVDGTPVNSLVSDCFYRHEHCQGSEATVVFDSQFVRESTGLWFLTRCPNGNSDSWFVNGERWNVPHTDTFTWHRAGDITSNIVTLNPREPNCEIRAAFAGDVEPSHDYECSCCVKQTSVFYTKHDSIYKLDIDGAQSRCEGTSSDMVCNDGLGHMNEVAVYSTCVPIPNTPTPTPTPPSDSRSATRTPSRTPSPSPPPSPSPSPIPPSPSPSPALPSPSPTPSVTIISPMVMVVTNTRSETEVGVSRVYNGDKPFPLKMALEFKQPGQSGLNYMDTIHGFEPSDVTMYFHKDVNCGIQPGEEPCSCHQNCSTTGFAPCCANFHQPSIEHNGDVIFGFDVPLGFFLFKTDWTIHCNNASIPRFYLGLWPGHGVYYNPTIDGVQYPDVKVSFQSIAWRTEGLQLSENVKVPFLPDGSATAFEQHDYCQVFDAGDGRKEEFTDFDRHAVDAPLCINTCGFQSWAGCFCDDDCKLPENKDCCDDSVRYCPGTVATTGDCPEGIVDCDGNCITRFYRRYIGDGVCDEGDRGMNWNCASNQFTSFDGGDCSESACPGGICPTSVTCPNQNDISLLNLGISPTGEFTYDENALVSIIDCDGNCAPAQALLDNHCDNGVDGSTINLDCPVTDILPPSIITALLNLPILQDLNFDASVLDNDRGMCVDTDLGACTVSHNRIGDGICDSDASYNSEDCHWDGGDCCYNTCRPSFYNCNVDVMDCQDPLGCQASDLTRLGDGICDDTAEYNTESCKYDGGDCCLDSTNPACVDPFFQ